jgi:putative transposase
MSRKRYPTDLTDPQWKRIAPLIPPPKPGGRPRRADMREVLDAIVYVTRSGSGWRMLPGDFPPWGTVWFYFRKWRDDGTWERMNARLREQVRRKAGRHKEPRIAVLDSQSVKTTDRGGERGFDAGKKGQRPQAAFAG